MSAISRPVEWQSEDYPLYVHAFGSLYEVVEMFPNSEAGYAVAKTFITQSVIPCSIVGIKFQAIIIAKDTPNGQG